MNIIFYTRYIHSDTSRQHPKVFIVVQQSSCIQTVISSNEKCVSAFPFSTGIDGIDNGKNLPGIKMFI